MMPEPDMYGGWKDWAKALIGYFMRRDSTVAVSDAVAYAPQCVALASGTATALAGVVGSRPVNAREMTQDDFYQVQVWGVATNTSGSARTMNLTFGVIANGVDVGTVALQLPVDIGGSAVPFFANMTLRSVGDGRLEFRGAAWGAIATIAGGPPVNGGTIAVSSSPFNTSNSNGVVRFTAQTSGTGCTADIRSATLTKCRAMP